MGYDVTLTGQLAITPPLNAKERPYLRRISRGSSKTVRRPGYTCPWEASDDGASLTVSTPYGTKEPVAEWLSYLCTHLFGSSGDQQFGRRLVGFTYEHRITGSVAVEGRTNGDKWTLSADEEGVWVDRVDLPCPACWADTLMVVRPSHAYRFTHPDPQANVSDGAYPHLDPDTYEDECLTGTWTPVGPSRRQITWPWVADVWGNWWIDLQTTPNAIPLRWPGTALDDDRLDTDTDTNADYFFDRFGDARDDPDDYDATEGQFDCVVLPLDRMRTRTGRREPDSAA